MILRLKKYPDQINASLRAADNLFDQRACFLDEAEVLQNRGHLPASFSKPSPEQAAHCVVSIQRDQEGYKHEIHTGVALFVNLCDPGIASRHAHLTPGFL